MTGIECALTGAIAKPAELKTSKGGKPWCALSLRIGDGEALQWVRVVAFGEMAEAAAQLAKGTNVYVEGRLSLNTWTGQDGAERSGLNVAARLVQPLGQIGRRRPRAEPDAERETGPRSDYQRPLDRKANGSRMDQEIPF